MIPNDFTQHIYKGYFDCMFVYFTDFGSFLTYSALQVQVITTTVHQSHIKAELKCLSSCSPAGRISYIWFNNGQKMMKDETSLYSGQFNPGDNISCTLKGHEDYRSPSVYNENHQEDSGCPGADSSASLDSVDMVQSHQRLDSPDGNREI
ncbi:B-cell receptor CD22-like [Scomber scombrus]|uniref:B-cell receptor CD22-like n=1 Tax=Scomber scombrus TaxID=13677 RepID=A0AAV1Q3S7_SCOSC